MKAIKEIVMIEHVKPYVYGGQAKINLPQGAVKDKEKYYDVILIPR